jgi:hypothetical protein
MPTCVMALGVYPDEVSTQIRLASRKFLFALVFHFFSKERRDNRRRLYLDRMSSLFPFIWIFHIDTASKR